MTRYYHCGLDWPKHVRCQETNHPRRAATSNSSAWEEEHSRDLPSTWSIHAEGRVTHSDAIKSRQSCAGRLLQFNGPGDAKTIRICDSKPYQHCNTLYGRS